MTEKTINIGGQEVRFRSSAAIPRLYRLKFGRDIFGDLSALEKDFRKNEGAEVSMLDVGTLEVFENVAYIMAKHADPKIPDTIDEWLDQFEMFSIYEVLPEILKLWGTNLITDAEAKKNFSVRRG